MQLLHFQKTISFHFEPRLFNVLSKKNSEKRFILGIFCGADVLREARIRLHIYHNIIGIISIKSKKRAYECGEFAYTAYRIVEKVGVNSLNIFVPKINLLYI